MLVSLLIEKAHSVTGIREALARVKTWNSRFVGEVFPYKGNSCSGQMRNYDFFGDVGKHSLINPPNTRLLCAV